MTAQQKAVQQALSTGGMSFRELYERLVAPERRADRRLANLAWSGLRRTLKAMERAGMVRGGDGVDPHRQVELDIAREACADPTCQRPAEKAGQCATHYERQRRGGAPGPIQPRAEVPTGQPRSVYLGDEWTRLVELAEARGVSASELVRQAVARWLAEEGLAVAQAARNEAVQAVLMVPADAPGEEKLAALERTRVAREALLEAEEALREAGGRP